MNAPDELRYSSDHEWVRVEDSGLRLGITDYAQDALGDITYLELPKVGTEIKAGSACGVVESVKTFSDIYAPVSGQVIDANQALQGSEALVNSSPYGEGWLFAVRLADRGEWDALLSAEAYRDLLSKEH